MAINQYSLEAMIVICVAHTFFAYTFATNAKASLGIHYPFSVDWALTVTWYSVQETVALVLNQNIRIF